MTAPPLYSIWMFDPVAEHHPAGHAAGRRRHGHRGRGRAAAQAAARRHRRQATAARLDADLVAEGAGLLSIRSVYDIMGVDQARTTAGTATSIANVSNPALAQYGSRLARFVRIEKPVSIPDDDDIADPDNSAFGPTGVMREIVAYAPVEPDGSVRMKVPANIAFQISVLDAERPPLQPRPSFLAAGSSG